MMADYINFSQSLSFCTILSHFVEVYFWHILALLEDSTYIYGAIKVYYFFKIYLKMYSYTYKNRYYIYHIGNM